MHRSCTASDFCTGRKELQSGIIVETKCREHCLPWEGISSLDGWETPHVLWNPKVYYCFHKSMPFVHITGKINPVKAVWAFFFKIHFNIILPSLLKFYKLSFPFRFPHQNPVCISLFPYVWYLFFPSYPPWFNYSDNIWSGVQILTFLVMQFSPVSSYVLPS